MPSLELPTSIEFAEEKDVPSVQEYRDRIEERRHVQFVEGYSFKEVENPENRFLYYADVNINNSRLWEITKQLGQLFPEVCACIFCRHEEEMCYGDYQSKENIIHVLDGFAKELTEDCFLEFGLIYDTGDTLTEVYVTRSKYLRVWGRDKELFQKIMRRNGLPELKSLPLVDEYPKIVWVLAHRNKEVKPTDAVLQLLDRAFITPSTSTSIA